MICLSLFSLLSLSCLKSIWAVYFLFYYNCRIKCFGFVDPLKFVKYSFDSGLTFAISFLPITWIYFYFYNFLKSRMIKSFIFKLRFVCLFVFPSMSIKRYISPYFKCILHILQYGILMTIKIMYWIYIYFLISKKVAFWYMSYLCIILFWFLNTFNLNFSVGI